MHSNIDANQFLTIEEITRSKLVGLTLKHFFPFSISEVKILFETTQEMLKSLNENEQYFEKKFSQIIFGTMVISFVIENVKYGMNYYPHPTIQRYDVINVLNNLHDRQAIRKFILEIGTKVLNKELPFSYDYIDEFFPTLSTNVPFIKLLCEKYLCSATKEGANIGVVARFTQDKERSLHAPVNDQAVYEDLLQNCNIINNQFETDINTQLLSISIRQLPLSFKAVYLGNLAVIKQLHNDGANIFYLIHCHNMAIDIVSFAAYVGKNDIVEYFLPLVEQLPRYENFCRISPLLWAILGDHPNTVNIVLDYYKKNKIDIREELNYEVKIKISNGIYEIHKILDFAIQRNVNDIIVSILPFVKNYTVETVKHALRSQNTVYVDCAINSRQHSVKKWLALIFNPKYFQCNDFTFNTLAKILFNDDFQNDESKLKWKINNYFYTKKKLLIYLLEKVGINSSGLELLMGAINRLKKESSLQEKIFLLKVFLDCEKVELGKELIHSINIAIEKTVVQENRGQYQACLFEILLSKYEEKLEKVYILDELMLFVKSELEKIVSIDFKNKLEILIHSMNEFLEENVKNNKIEKFNYLLDLLKQFNRSDQIRVLVKLYITCGVCHDYTFIMYLERMLSDYQAFNTNHCLKAFAQARSRLDSHLPIELCDYFFNKIPRSEIFNQPNIAESEYPIYENYNIESILTSLLYSIRNIIDNTELVEKYKATIVAIMELSADNFYKLSSSEQEKLSIIFGDVQMKKLLDQSIDSSVLEKIYMTNSQKRGEQFVFFKSNSSLSLPPSAERKTFFLYNS